MSTQYDDIGLSYNSLKRLPAAILERNNLQTTLTPFSAQPNTTVLDLACGAGYYSSLALSWGASRVVGVDISPAMIAAAQSQTSDTDKSKLTFCIGDCTQPLHLPPEAVGPFDIVLGAWLLNYAGTPTEMTSMFANIATYLKPGGHFVGITPHPAEDLDTFAELFDPSRSGSMRTSASTKYGVSVAYTAKVVHGYRTRVTGHVKPKEISFENFHLDRRVYERCAREGGLNGTPEWRDVRLPGSEEESKREYGIGLDFWDGYLDAPHFGILVIQK
ncbi:hypothetical protein LTS07_001179 [Exophiala sideris]|uniref:Methyltransferase domain-containing protein n=1 Tax=Exophiala sideris TaxID=1016849 RepID=A0ABR0JMP7_9EURO|nr:hypothetical protein LTS07_001179 [Exophiala sideris]KAK5043694.1 hypothetical protein LTR13_000048 [Exophiala sideris]KAK5067193.1 hypothetical protein LTR69_001180 [Exophiala sideris]KAK5182526.1 hypothetical protein LTR44_004917 [Eurotiomycetes sp. CCFEE 6388]